MSRSAPNDRIQNPASRFFSWDGDNGNIYFYDKDLEVKGKDKPGGNVPVNAIFTFILLDELATIKGFNKPAKSGIFSNEVRNTQEDILSVKTFDKNLIAEGLYKNIKAAVVAAGGKYCASLYIAYKDDDGLRIGNLALKGAGFGPWLEFAKKNRADIYKKAIYISGKTEGKTGKIVFQMPVFALKDVNDETNDAATELDKQLQIFLSSYLSRTKTQQTREFEHEEQPHGYSDEDAPSGNAAMGTPEDDDVPWSPNYI